MPVGTQASVKGLDAPSLIQAGSQIILGNTYHLMLRPGKEIFEHFGGIHSFMNWDKPVLTDSGGFQIFSLPHSRLINSEGARFKSYVDGRDYLLSPETSIAMQQAIGSDIMMVLDQCIPSTADYQTAKAAMQRTHEWAERSLKARGNSRQALFGIVQGACHESLRRESARVLQELHLDGDYFDGLAIGGLAVGESKQEREDFTQLCTEQIRDDLPRYLMGVGTPLDILEGVHRGVDMFDCIIPVALGHRGVVFTSQGKIQLRRSVYDRSQNPLDPECNCPSCKAYSRGYLHHLIKADEILGWNALALHNIYFYHKLMAEIRSHISNDSFLAYYKAQRETLNAEDPEFPVSKDKKTGAGKEKTKQLGNYEIYENPAGWNSIRHKDSGETMHSVNNPDEEARRLYVDQPRLARRLYDPSANEALRIWDVGMGAAHNALAALNCAERLDQAQEQKRKIRQEKHRDQEDDLVLFEPQTPQRRSLEIYSFEEDLDSLRLVVRHSAHFPHAHHPGPSAILKHGFWENSQKTLRWQLIPGNFLDHYKDQPSPELIYWDPFSAKTNTDLWSYQVFRDLFAYLRENAQQGSLLCTYSASTAIRAALIASGFYTAPGYGSGPKEATTVASNLSFAQGSGFIPFGRTWLAHWERSQAPFPGELQDSEKQAFKDALYAHPQFLEM